MPDLLPRVFLVVDAQRLQDFFKWLVDLDVGVWSAISLRKYPL